MSNLEYSKITELRKINSFVIGGFLDLCFSSSESLTITVSLKVDLFSGGFSLFSDALLALIEL
jgi:hypothetical protein